jgi:hypothetical protein
MFCDLGAEQFPQAQGHVGRDDEKARGGADLSGSIELKKSWMEADRAQR